MEKKKRLFLFAAFDPKGIIDDSTIYYISELSKVGDVVYFQDNDVVEIELSKIAHLVLFACGTRHEEYDFGSHKRSYLWVRENNLLDNYDWVYLVNDSVYGPLYPLLPILEKLETSHADVVGMAYPARKKVPHIQSWFLGVSRKISTSEWFNVFITSVVKQKQKVNVCNLYEIGFSALCREKGFDFAYIAIIRRRWHRTYTNPKYLFRKGIPFFKKAAFIYRGGIAGRQVLYILNNVQPNLQEIITKNAEYLYGKDSVRDVLTKNMLKIFYRNVKYLVKKIFGMQ